MAEDAAVDRFWMRGRRTTIVALTAALLAVVAFRIGPKDLSHFDEGQYAFAMVWPWAPQFEPSQAYFSPPLFPFLVGCVQWLCGPVWWAGALISKLALLAGLAIAFRELRRLSFAFSVRFTLAMLLVVVWSDPILGNYAGAGLTDSLYSTLALAALVAARRAYREPTAGRILAAGLLASLSWWAKYSGPMTLAAMLAMCERRSHLRLWLGMAAIATLGILPWYAIVERFSPQGLAGLLQHQRGYTMGLFTLPDNLFLRVPFQCGELAGDSWLAGLGMLPGPLAFAFLALPYVRRKPGIRPWFLAAMVMLAMPALYWPYLRLWLPCRLPLALAALAIMQQGGLFFVAEHRAAHELRELGGWLLVSVGWCAASLYAGLMRPIDRPLPRNRYAELLPRIVREDLPIGAKEAWLALEPPALFVWGQMPNAFPARRIANASTFGLKDLPPGVLLFVDWRTPAELPLDHEAEVHRMEFPVELSNISKLDAFGTVAPDPHPTLRVYWRK